MSEEDQFLTLNEMQSALLNVMFGYDADSDTITATDVVATSETVRDLIGLEAAGLVKQVVRNAYSPFAVFQPSQFGIDQFRGKLREAVYEGK